VTSIFGLAPALCSYERRVDVFFAIVYIHLFPRALLRFLQVSARKTTVDSRPSSSLVLLIATAFMGYVPAVGPDEATGLLRSSPTCSSAIPLIGPSNRNLPIWGGLLPSATRPCTAFLCAGTTCCRFCHRSASPVCIWSRCTAQRASNKPARDRSQRTARHDPISSLLYG